MVTIASAVVGAIAVFGVRTVLDGRAPSLPDSIQGVPRMTDALAATFESQMQDEADKYGIDMAAGLYGSPSPEFFVLYVDDSARETTDELFDSFVAGMAEGGAVAGDATDVGTRQGADYRCLPVTGTGVSAGACMWRTDTDVGIVFQLGADVPTTKQLLFTVHDLVTS